MNKIRYKIITLLLATALFCGCKSELSSPITTEPTTTESITATPITVPIPSTEILRYDEEDLSTIFDAAEMTTLTLSDQDVRITQAGVYLLTGTLTNAQIIVDAADEDIVNLVFQNVDISNSKSAPIYIANADKTIITLTEGTVNTITDSREATTSDSESDAPNAALFSHDDLTINGTGSLNVYTNYNNGIVSKDDLIITGGNLNIVALDDGMIGRDVVLIQEAVILIEAGGDGIKSTNDEETDLGSIGIESGTFSIQSGADAIQASSSILITDGDFSIVTGTGSLSEENSAKGLKAMGDITIIGGTFNIQSTDDAIHTNATANILGGTLEISSGDDGIHGDIALNISGGSITIAKSYEGLESAVITISGGTIDVIASDDGINVAGGNDQSAVGGRPGQNTFSDSGTYKLIIAGGTITVNADGDGLDANGSIEMSGGTVIVNGPTNSGNGALDYDGTFIITGGLLIANGSSGMAQAPTESSSQTSVLMTYETSLQAGTTATLSDSQGNVIATIRPIKTFQTIVFSSPDLIAGETYNLTTENNSTIDFQITSSVTWLNESGVTSAASFQQPGGGKPGQGGPGGVKPDNRP